MQKRLQKRFNHKNVITVSEGIEQHFLHKFNVKPHAIRTIYNPIDVEAIRTLAEQPCKELPAEPYLCHAARFDPQKRHDVLLEAYAKLPAKSRPKLMLLTTPCIALTQLVAYYDVAEDVIIKAFVQNPYVYFKHAELCMLSSDCEGFGLVIAESLACGTPVVSTRAPSGPEEILVGEMASWLVPVGDSDALAAKVTELLRIKPKVPSGALQCFQVGRIVLEYASLIAP
jgi:glycosyltransferase involved in cell wall biosynthesis